MNKFLVSPRRIKQNAVKVWNIQRNPNRTKDILKWGLSIEFEPQCRTDDLRSTYILICVVILIWLIRRCYNLLHPHENKSEEFSNKSQALTYRIPKGLNSDVIIFDRQRWHALTKQENPKRTKKRVEKNKLVGVAPSFRYGCQHMDTVTTR